MAAAAKSPPPISVAERLTRLDASRAGMDAAGQHAVLLGATSRLRYFTGISWYPSERFLGAIVHAKGGVDYIAPRFELDKVRQLISIDGDVLTWEEDESPFRLIAKHVGPNAVIGLDDGMALFMYRH